jgi:hypothetical protein
MPEPKDYSNIIPELEPFYIEVGRIASAWANMEFHMDRLLWDTMRLKRSSPNSVSQ